jgi:hypothetical protein
MEAAFVFDSGTAVVQDYIPSGTFEETLHTGPRAGALVGGVASRTVVPKPRGRATPAKGRAYRIPPDYSHRLTPGHNSLTGCFKPWQ